MKVLADFVCFTIRTGLQSTKFAQTILKNHFGFTIQLYLQLNYASCNVTVDSLRFISFQENYQAAEIYFYSYYVI